ncbi:hypothetical protein BDV93DRAFT_607552 [Ceratobasidium sp. AG-I]|nr:hypothetical protein BDV93DRAFT_607552 [Ceratobasidium sp. AG-I]
MSSYQGICLHPDTPANQGEPKLSEDNREEPVDAPLDERMHIPALPALSPIKRRLLVLDLNGTLLHRRRTKTNANAHVYTRPYLGAFLRYISHPAVGLDVAVWSSARRENVHSMVERAWSGAGAVRIGNRSGSGSADEALGRVRFPDLVYAREDMILSDRQFTRAFRHGTFNPDHNVRTTKDLRQLWLRLSQLREQQLRELTQRHESEHLPDSDPGAPSIQMNEVRVQELHGPHDTILLDDSMHKARLQPNNHLSLPTYGAAELLTDVNALTSPASALIDAPASPHVDEALLAVVGILSEMGSERIDEWTRSGRIWSGPGAQLDPQEMWAQRRRGVAPDTTLAGASASTLSTSPPRSLTSRLSALPSHAESSPSILPPYEPDPPFISTRRPAVPGEMPQWFSSPPLMSAWIAHGQRVLRALGIEIEHECVRVWPGWREGRMEILGRAKDDVADPNRPKKQAKGQKGGKGRGNTEPVNPLLNSLGIPEGSVGHNEGGEVLPKPN